MKVGRTAFLSELARLFPDVVQQIRPDEAGLLHLEVGAFRRATEQAMDAGSLWSAERHFQYVERMLAVADDELRNALDVSYLEDLAFGEHTPQRHRAVKERMPRPLRERLIRHSDWWR